MVPIPLNNDQAIIDQAIAILESRARVPGQLLTSPEDTKNYLRMRLGHKEQEVFSALFLDNRHRLIEFRAIFFGTIDGASVHPREVVRAAIELNAAAVILAHNHPSGFTDPSGADRDITRRLREALNLIDVRVLDHIIVSATDTTSFAEKGLL